MTKEELKDFRARLAKARSDVNYGWRASAPLRDNGLCVTNDGDWQLKCQITMSGKPMDIFQFDNWCYSVDVDTVRLAYTNSIAALDKRIAEGK